MTKGRLIFVEDDIAFAMPEIECDMQPEKRGNMFLFYFIAAGIESLEDMKMAYKEILKDEYDKLEDLKITNVKKEDIFKLYSDYLYIVDGDSFKMYFFDKFLESFTRKKEYEILLSGLGINQNFEYILAYYSNFVRGQHTSFKVRVQSQNDKFDINEFIYSLLKVMLNDKTSKGIDEKKNEENQLNAEYTNNLLKEIINKVSSLKDVKEFYIPDSTGKELLKENEDYKVFIGVIDGYFSIKFIIKKNYLKAILEALKLYDCYLRDDISELYSSVSKDDLSAKVMNAFSENKYVFAKEKRISREEFDVLCRTINKQLIESIKDAKRIRNRK